MELNPKLERVLERLGELLYPAANRYRRTVAAAVYSVISVGAFTFAFLFRFDFTWLPEYNRVFAIGVVLLIVVRQGINATFQLTTGRWRFVSTRDVLRLALATSVGTVLFYLLTLLPPFVPSIPRSVILLEWVLTTFSIAGLWIVYRTAYETLRHLRSGFNGNASRVLIVGAGEAGNLLAREMLRFPTGYRCVGLVDDDPAKFGQRIYGVEVLGAAVDLPKIASVEHAEMIIIAVPSAEPAELRRIVELCESAELPFKVLPGIAQVLAGNVHLNQLRDVRIEDLLGREPIQLTLPELAADLADSTVLITGAAGSIGSELARQVALHKPKTLLLLDQAETDLFFLDMDLKEQHPGLSVVPIICDVVDVGGVERVFRQYRPDRIYHAAAYKHVPMMEANPRAAVRNNVIGTYRVAEAAGRYKAANFVLVSTDKAVRPVSVMGATKRAAELVVLELQERFPGTAYAAVRFGNVLGSSGSVIPIFQKQLREGRPLTVTHPDATRYFMTIPEAVQLILQASLLPEVRGSVAMLEMGAPVRIAELAANLLRLSGASSRASGVVYTGLRPGERLHEQLVAPGEETFATRIHKVRLVRTVAPFGGVLSLVKSWEDALNEGREAGVLAYFSQLCEGHLNGNGNGNGHAHSNGHVEGNGHAPHAAPGDRLPAGRRAALPMDT